MATLTAERATAENGTPPCPPCMDTCPFCGSSDITSNRGDDGRLYSMCNACTTQWVD